MKRVIRELRDYRNAIDSLADSWKHPHHARCPRCRTISFMALLKGETPDILLATELVRDHQESGKDYGTPKCDLEGCASHERLPLPVAHRMLKIHRGEITGGDSRGRKLGTFDLNLGLPSDPVGTVFLRFTRCRASAHVWVEPPEEGAGEIHPLKSIARGWDAHFESCRKGCLDQYRDARLLAEADLDLEPARKWELRAPGVKLGQGK